MCRDQLPRKRDHEAKQQQRLSIVLDNAAKVDVDDRGRPCCEQDHRRTGGRSNLQSAVDKWHVLFAA